MHFHEDLIMPRLELPDSDAVLERLGNAVIAAGYAREDYVTGLQQREREFPTGLPISGGVAIPHTAAEYVSTDTLAVATLAEPVTFFEMGGEPDATVEVSSVFMLVLADSSRHVKLLSRLIGRLQKDAFVRSVREANDARTIVHLLNEAFPG